MLMAIIMMLSLTTSVFAADPPASAEPEVIVEEAAQNSPDPSASPAPGDDPSRLSTVYEGHRIHYIDSKKQPLPKNAELFMNEINEDDIPFYLQRAAHSLGLGSIWIHRAKEEFETDKYKQLLKKLGVEGEWEGIGHCAVGFIDGDRPQAAPRKPNRVFYVE